MAYLPFVQTNVTKYIQNKKFNLQTRVGDYGFGRMAPCSTVHITWSKVSEIKNRPTFFSLRFGNTDYNRLQQYETIKYLGTDMKTLKNPRRVGLFAYHRGGTDRRGTCLPWNTPLTWLYCSTDLSARSIGKNPIFNKDTIFADHNTSRSVYNTNTKTYTYAIIMWTSV